jgi:CBS-domain-containing membrane protein
MRVSEVMSRDVVTIARSHSCHAATAEMTRNSVRQLPVVAEDGTLEGIVTDRDLRHQLRSFVSGPEDGPAPRGPKSPQDRLRREAAARAAVIRRASS